MKNTLPQINKWDTIARRTGMLGNWERVALNPKTVTNPKHVWV